MSFLENGDRYVVDAPIVVKWILNEPYSDMARGIAVPGRTVLAPDVILSHIGTILRTRVSSAELEKQEADEILRVVGLMPLQLFETWSLAADALEIERRIRCAMPSCIYLALALQEDAIYVTSSRELYTSVQDTALAEHTAWIGNLALR